MNERNGKDEEDFEVDEELRQLLEGDDEEEKPKAKTEGEGDADQETPEPEEEEAEDENLAEFLDSIGVKRAPKPAAKTEEQPRTEARREEPRRVDASADEVEEVMQKIARGTDPVSRVMQGLIRHNYQTQRRLDDFEALQRVPARVRDAVDAEYKTGDYRTVKAAHAAVIGKLVSGELKLDGSKKKSKPKEKEPAPREDITETFVRQGGRRAGGPTLDTLKEMPADKFYKLINGEPTRLTQAVYRRWRSGKLTLT